MWGSSGSKFGKVETLIVDVLKARSIRDEWVTGMEIFKSIEETNPKVSFGKVYTSLDRLIWRKEIESKLGQPQPERGGRARKYYRIPREDGGIRVQDKEERVSAIWQSAPSMT